MKLLEGEIIRCDSHITNAKSEEERNKFVEKKRQLREQREKLRRNAYIKYLATKDLSLAGAMKTFVEN